jgi:hypothetical protein
MAKISKEVIVGWLKDMGFNPKPVPDAAGDWRYSICIPPTQEQNRLEVFGSKQLPRAVIVGSNTAISPEHSSTLIALDADAKREFLAALVNALNKEFVEYQLEMDQLTGDVKSFRVTAVRYDDGLTLDSFNRTVGSVYKTQIAAIQCVQQFLGGTPPEGGEFAFRKLGIQ